MSVAFYMDENIDSRITKELRKRELDILTAQEDGYNETPDIEILDRASSLARVVVTYDHHFPIEAHRRLDKGIYFAPSPFEVGFMSVSHSDKVVDETLTVIESVFKKWRV